MFKKVFLFTAILSCCVVFGQKSYKQRNLERKRSQLKKEIYRVNKLLFSTQKQSENLLGNLEDINKKVQVRTDYVSAIEEEVGFLNSQVTAKQDTLKILNNELSALKEDYGQMIYKSYQSKSEQSKLMFLLSSEDFFQAYKRYRYMQQYASYRKKQGEAILEKTKILDSLKRNLESQKQTKQTLLNKSKAEVIKLALEKNEQETLVQQVKSKAQFYRSEINQKQTEERNLERQIERVIAEAIAASKTKSSTKTSAKKSKKKSGFSLTPEGKQLAARFQQNRGKLPWPVLEGVVTRKYGVIPHPTLSGIKIDSKGIHITTKKQAVARAVFKGEVLAIQSVNGRHAVYVQHGNYISLYNNLDRVYVTKGQRVVLKQTLGTVFQDKISGKTILKFQIWKDTQRQNPTYWLARM